MSKKILFGLLTLIFLSACQEQTLNTNNNPNSLDGTPENGTETEEVACKDIETQVKDTLESINYCEKDNDCIVLPINVTCPFGCYNFANKNLADSDIEYIKNLTGKYESSCVTCMYKCLPQPTQNEIGCRNNKCIDLR